MFCISAVLQAQDITHLSGVNWTEGKLSITAVYHGGYSPLLRTNGEKMLDSYIDTFFKEQLLALQYDSYRTVQDLAVSEPELMDRLSDLGLRGIKESSRMADNLTSLEVTYTFRLFPDIIDLFIRHPAAEVPHPLLSFVPTAHFTGIIIVIPGKMPVHGEHGEADFTRSLFPKIFDEKMRPVFTANMADPASLRKWGPLLFTTDTDEDKFRDRTGYFPLYICAKELFGTARTDIVLFQYDADRILASAHNIDLLKNGKAAVIILEEKL